MRPHPFTSSAQCVGQPRYAITDKIKKRAYCRFFLNFMFSYYAAHSFFHHFYHTTTVFPLRKNHGDRDFFSCGGRDWELGTEAEGWGQKVGTELLPPPWLAARKFWNFKVLKCMFWSKMLGFPALIFYFKSAIFHSAFHQKNPENYTPAALSHD